MPEQPFLFPVEPAAAPAPKIPLTRAPRRKQPELLSYLPPAAPLAKRSAGRPRRPRPVAIDLFAWANIDDIPLDGEAADAIRNELRTWCAERLADGNTAPLGDWEILARFAECPLHWCSPCSAAAFVRRARASRKGKLAWLDVVPRLTPEDLADPQRLEAATAKVSPSKRIAFGRRSK